MNSLIFIQFRLFFFFIILCLKAFGQPYVDLVQLNHQHLQSKYKSSGDKNITDNSFLGVLLPIRIDSQNVFIFRVNGERLAYERHGVNGASEDFYAMLAGIGWQHQFNPSWSVTALFLPKVSSVLKDAVSAYDWQYGGTLLAQFKPRKNIRYKLGLYYNREPFGNFYVPLVGVDWQINEKNWIYGQLPLFMRYEHKTTKKLYTGVGLKIYGRSYRLSADEGHAYVWNQENQFKLFADYYFKPKMVLFAEVGQTFSYGLDVYPKGRIRENPMQQIPLYNPIKDGIFVNFGCVFRVRTGI